MLLVEHFCQFVRRNRLILGFKSVYGILNLSGVKSKTDLAVESTLISSHSNVAWYPAYKNLFRVEYGV